jgi:hypothetical protein
MQDVDTLINLIRERRNSPALEMHGSILCKNPILQFCY